MIRRCREVGLPEPKFSISDGFVTTIWRQKKEETGQVSGQVAGQVEPWLNQVIKACAVKPLKSSEIQEVTGIRHRETFQRNYLDRLLADGLLERTIPDKPKSRLQKYRLSNKGVAMLKQLSKKE